MGRSQRQRNALVLAALRGSDMVLRRGLEPKDRAGHAYRFRLTVVEAPAPVWRRVMVHGEMSLRSLNRVVRRAFGWPMDHRYVLSVRRPWTAPRKAVVKRQVRVCDVVSWGDALTFSYDYGGGWSVDAVVEELVETSPKFQPACLGGGGYSSTAKEWSHEAWLRAVHGERSGSLESSEPAAPIDVAAIDWKLKGGRYPLIEWAQPMPRRGRRRRRRRR